MARDGVGILEDDEEADTVSFMLNACGIESRDFYLNERILTRENFEKNYKSLLKMLEGRDFMRASYFVFGYFALLTGAGFSEKIRQKILEVAKWEHEEGYWTDKEFAIMRKVYLEDFREKINIHKAGKKLHTARFKYSGQDFINSSVVIGLNQFRETYDTGKIYETKHINLDGWDLNSIPQEIFTLKNLKSLSLEHNQISEIPKEISNLTSLKYLYFCYNQLKTLPESLGMLKQLKGLNIIHNNIPDLPNSLRNLTKLKYIYVRGTQINKVPKFLGNAKLDEINQTIYL